MLLTMQVVHRWHTQHLDYVLALPQAPVERDLYRKVPKYFETEDRNEDNYVLKIHWNIYIRKQAGRLWNQYLVEKLVNVLGFNQSTVEECVFYRGKTLYVLYTDDPILAVPYSK